ncbi:Cytochrome P450 94A2 [Camellia lanceoleosa]|uniref:Cytochrome P450 94A2 n=1 Tax=Camellia lanceoleosa TaxID=1840588 RepID=A0ACC0FUX1_9ERIC|nr:Cytochrome P450 94A2 [Camellia lanceoleosa]
MYVFAKLTEVLFSDGIFNVDGENWKFQRQVASHEFNTKSLRKFVETVVDTELSDRLIPIFCSAAANKTVLDFQDILQRFAFDNICKIAFGHDPAYLLPSLPQEKFAVAFDAAARISGQRKQELGEKSSLESVDLLSRFLSSGHSDENFVTDIVISFILAGRDTTSAALTWFFWLISRHPDVENEIPKEIDEESEAASFEEVKNMVYTHASLSESMRLYPLVPVDRKEAVDDVLPDGTVIKKVPPREVVGNERRDGRKVELRARDPYTYPVFQAGPRICPGKDMAFLQMKRVVSGVLRRFKVVPAFEEDVEPVFMAHLTSKMKGGFPVRIEERAESF